MRTVVAFDITVDRVRYRVSRVLKEYGLRVQKSVYEGPDLEPAVYLRMRSRCEGLIDHDTDCMRYYRLCASCAARIEHVGAGQGLVVQPELFEVIG